jgi:hypothetical protein
MAITKTQKWLLILTPIVIGVGYIVYKLLQGGQSALPSSYPKQGFPTNTQPSVPASTSTSDFPLKVGSNNKSVMALQDALGVTIDGIFGSKTLAALQAQANLSSISDANQLANVIAQLNQSKNNSAYEGATRALLNLYDTNTGLSYLNLSADSNWIQLNQAADGSFTYANAQFFVPNGTQYDISKVIPDVEDMGTGKLVIIDNRSGNSVYWLADPNAIFLS